jgi:uncharacterized membrane protein
MGAMVVIGIVVLFVLVVITFVAVVLVVAISSTRSRRVLTDAAPASSLEERLRELDDLHGRGVISDEERATTRARLLAEG